MSLYANFSPWSSTCLCPNHWQKKMFLKREKTNSEFYFHNFIFVRVRNQQTNEMYFSRSHDDIQALAGIELNAFSNNIMSPDFHNTFQMEKNWAQVKSFLSTWNRFLLARGLVEGKGMTWCMNKKRELQDCCDIWKIAISWWKRVDIEVLIRKIRMSRTTLVINVFAYICLSGCY